VRQLLGFALTTLAVCAAPETDRAAGQDKVIGAIWELHAKNPSTGRYESRGAFRCTEDGKVYKDGKIVGTHKSVSLEAVEITITAAPNPRGNGTTKATRVTKTGSVWEGVHENLKGETIPVRLFLKKD
jgi:hypothetical protein